MSTSHLSLFSKRKIGLNKFLLAIFLIFIVFYWPSSATVTTPVKILIPLYAYPTWYEPETYIWKDIVTAAKDVAISVIINPNNGPDGKPPNQDYARGLEDLRRADLTILGYVYTKYGERPIEQVKRDIELYHQHYHLEGIFLDEAASGVDKLGYYQEIYRYIKTKTNLERVVINPGTHTAENYLSQAAADTVVIFEQNSQAWQEYQPQPYVNGYPAENFASLIHSVPDAATMKRHIDRAVERNIGYVYVTDDSLSTANGDPWDSLPSYWQQEVEYIRSLKLSK
jgi:hypothetical protein